MADLVVPALFSTPLPPPMVVAGLARNREFPLVADQRILRGAPATASVTWRNADGEPVDASGSVSVEVASCDGTVLIAAGTPATHGGTGGYTVPLSQAMTASLDVLICVWTDTTTTTYTTLVDVCGGFYFGTAEARAFDASLQNTTTYPDAAILDRRRQVEDECEWICDVAFVPRYRRVTLDGTGTSELILPDHMVRTVRSVRTYSDTAAGTYVAFTSTELAALSYDGDSRIERTDGNAFVEGRGNLIVEYEHGYDRPENLLKDATLLRLRNRLNIPRSGIPDTATEVSTNEGGVTYRLGTPDAYKTGMREVDSVYSRFSLRARSEDGTSTTVPAGRRLDYDPQYWSLFHPGRR